MKPTTLLTGATGFLGSNLGYRLLMAGHRVKFLVRPGEIASQVRLEHAMRVIDPRFRLHDYDCDIIEGNVNLAGCGLTSSTTQALTGTIDEIWHCAASVSFSYGDLENTRSVNVGGTRNVVELATDLGNPDLHHVSTAYVVGFGEGRFLETTRDAGLFKNPYEKTKAEGEGVVHTYGGRHSIYRPSIIVGDASTSRTLTFTGVYGIMQVFHLLRSQLMNRLRCGPEASRSSGVDADSAERIALPIIVPCTENATFNIVPVDWVADTMLQLGSSGACDKTYHLTHPEPISVRWFIERLCNILGLEGIRFENAHVYHVLANSPELVHESSTLQELQRSLINWLRVLWPYFCHTEPVFDIANVRNALGPKYLPPPRITEAFLRDSVQYAIAKRFRHRRPTITSSSFAADA